MVDNQNNEEVHNLISETDQDVSSDKILDLKNGIYNLFVSLFNYYVIDYGPTEAVELSTKFLDEISNNFKQILNNNTQNKEQV